MNEVSRAIRMLSDMELVVLALMNLYSAMYDDGKMDTIDAHILTALTERAGEFDELPDAMVQLEEATT